MKGVKIMLCKIDWMDLSEQFFGTSSDSNDVIWNQAHQAFYYNKSTFENNMPRLQTLEIPIAISQARHNCLGAKKNIPKNKMAYISVHNLQRELM